jgi:HPt (histidine-containing phosphotransfer) domain-containing protein
MSPANFASLHEPEPKAIAIDEDHLGRMTLGDRSLEREVLEIFARQTTLTLERIAGAAPERAAAAAHTLKGSARGIGAWRVAQAAERLERAAIGAADESAMRAAIAELEAASFEARVAIGLRLQGPADQPAAFAFGEGRRGH